MGFEPTNFCMAIRPVSETSAEIGGGGLICSCAPRAAHRGGTTRSKWGTRLLRLASRPKRALRRDRGKGTACGAAERLGSSQFDYAQEEQKDPRDNGRDEQRAATAEPVGEEDEHEQSDGVSANDARVTGEAPLQTEYHPAGLPGPD